MGYDKGIGLNQKLIDLPKMTSSKAFITFSLKSLKPGKDLYKAIDPLLFYSALFLRS